MSAPSYPKHPAREPKATTEATTEAMVAATGEGTAEARTETTPPSAPGATIHIVVNGEPRHVAAGTTVTGLLAELGLAERRVAVERNREVVPRADHARTALADGDTLELVTFVGGG